MTDTSSDISKKLLEKEATIVKALFLQVIKVIKAGRYRMVIFDKRVTKLRFWEWDSQANTVSTPTSREYNPTKLIPDSIMMSKKSVLKTTKTEFEKWLRGNKWSYKNKTPRSWLAVPMIAGRQTSGMVILEDFERENAFDQRDESILGAMAQRAGEALAKVQFAQRLRNVNDVGQELASSINLSEDDILELIHQTAGNLMDTRDMYIALYDEDKGVLEFPLFYLNGKKEDWPAAPMDLTDRKEWTLDKEVFDTKKSLNVSDFETWYFDNEYPLPEAKPYPESWLGVPLVSQDRILGLISLQNDEVEGAFGQGDVEVLEIMAGQAAVALENARLYETLEQRVEERTRQLEERTQQIASVYEVNLQLASSVNLSEGNILELIHQTAGNLMDTRDMYIALYDDNKGILEFPLFYLNGKKEDWPAAPMDLTDRKEWTLTKEVFDTRKSLNVPDFRTWYIDNDYPLPEAKPYPKSWLGVPLISQKKVLGLISLQNDEVEGVFGQGDVEVLEIMAGQAAVALENAKLYNDQAAVALENAKLYNEVTQKNELLNSALNRITETETVLTRANIATDFVHRLNNLAGTIPIWVDQIRDHLEEAAVEKDTTLKEYLDNIESNTHDLLRAAEQLKSPPPEEDVDLEKTLKSLVRQVRVQTPAELEVNLAVKELPKIRAVSSELPNALWSIIENSIDAMPRGGSLDIEARTTDKDDHTWIEIIIEDSGSGISPEQYNNIFMPFYTTKGGTHMGYGLWRAKNTFERLGGEITFESVENAGTAFTIKLPAK